MTFDKSMGTNPRDVAVAVIRIGLSLKLPPS
jgi:hypothetical protein